VCGDVAAAAAAAAVGARAGASAVSGGAGRGGLAGAGAAVVGKGRPPTPLCVSVRKVCVSCVYMCALRKCVSSHA